jgi:hypothetical protein
MKTPPLPAFVAVIAMTRQRMPISAMSARWPGTATGSALPQRRGGGHRHRLSTLGKKKDAEVHRPGSRWSEAGTAGDAEAKA